MATSGTVSFRTDRDTIIKGALRLCSAYDPENSSGPTTNQISGASEALNLLAKKYEARGLELWERRWGVIFPQLNQGVFSLGNPGPAGDHSCLANPLGKGDFVNTTLASGASAGASTITVVSVSSGYTVGLPVFSIASTYYIGIKLDDNTLQWTTVSGSPSGTSVTLATPLTYSASAGNRVFCYQTKLMRPLRILDGWVRQLSGGNDIPVNIIPRENYNRFGMKTSAGTPIQLYYDPQVNVGNVFIYPVFSTVDQLLFIEFQKPVDDFSSSTNDYDLPQEWGEVLKFKLALAIAPEYEVTDTKYKQIKDLSDEAFDLVDGYDQETGSLFIQPNQTMIESLNK